MEHPVIDQKHFCCAGCETVYNILHDNGLDAYYQFSQKPGISQKNTNGLDFDYLDDPLVIKKLLSFSENGIAKISFDIPQIHCSSCLWLIENIMKLNQGIISSRVNFIQKQATIQYHEDQISLKELVRLLATIGYNPKLNFQHLDNPPSTSQINRELMYKLGLSGFVFGNIMLLSFIEYLGFQGASAKMYVGYINLALALPVLLYAARDYFSSAWRSLKIGHFNIDLPIVIGAIALFGRSVYEILSQTGEGYLDSFTGFIFFLTIGKWFQEYTYGALDFDRNYKSYFPISILIKNGQQWISRSIENIHIDDLIMVRNLELIPADGVLTKGDAQIDYSFVSGESNIITKSLGEVVWAGGRQVGGSIELKVTKKVDQGYFTRLWNDDIFQSSESSTTKIIIDRLSKYFTLGILILSLLTLIYWLRIDLNTGLLAFTSVLIVACPCALALAIPFTYGTLLRKLATHGIYLRNTETIEKIQEINHIVFDKTGTITDTHNIEVIYHGTPLTEDQKSMIKSCCMQSTHPLSIAIVSNLPESALISVEQFSEQLGAGITAVLHSKVLRMGSSSFIFGVQPAIEEDGVFVEYGGTYLGHFTFKHGLRDGLQAMIEQMGLEYPISLLSGDTDREKYRFKTIMGENTALHFNQNPLEKLEYIKSLQQENKKIMMIGDGLNDAGALKQSQIGIVVADDNINFSPTCDVIVKADSFKYLLSYIHIINKAKWLIYGAFLLAFLYNSIGLSYAMTGNLSPIVAAILMPLSSITIVIYGVIGSLILVKKYFSN